MGARRSARRGGLRSPEAGRSRRRGRRQRGPPAASRAAAQETASAAAWTHRPIACRPRRGRAASTARSARRSRGWSRRDSAAGARGRARAARPCRATDDGAPARDGRAREPRHRRRRGRRSPASTGTLPRQSHVRRQRRCAALLGAAAGQRLQPESPRHASASSASRLFPIRPRRRAARGRRARGGPAAGCRAASTARAPGRSTRRERPAPTARRQAHQQTRKKPRARLRRAAARCERRRTTGAASPDHGEQLREQRIERSRDIGLPRVQRRDGLRQNGGHRRGRADSEERIHARQDLVEQDAEREDVGATISGLPANLLGRHVHRRPAHDACAALDGNAGLRRGDRHVCGSRVANPKSIALTCPSSPRMTLAGLNRDAPPGGGALHRAPRQSLRRRAGLRPAAAVRVGAAAPASRRARTPWRCTAGPQSRRLRRSNR